MMVARLPDSVLLSGPVGVAFPALAAEIRNGANLKEHYLRALGLIAVLYWPAHWIVLALLAYPVVRVVMGQQWLAVVPLPRLSPLPISAWFPVGLGRVDPASRRRQPWIEY